MGEQIHVANELDYKKLLSSHPTYKLNKVLPLTGSQTTLLSNAGGNETIFEIPAYVFNFAQSRFDFTLNIAQSGAGTYTTVFKDVIGPIRQIQVYTRAGLYLMDIPYFNNYTKITRKQFTKIEKYLDYPLHDCDYNSLPTGGSVGSNGGYFGGDGSFLRKNNCTVAGAYAYTAVGPAVVNYPVSAVRAAGPPVTLAHSIIGLRHDGSLASMNYTEPQYFEIGAVGSGTPPYQLNVSIPFYAIKKCLLSLNKDLYFGGETLIFRVVWDSTAKIAYLTSGNSPLSGTAGNDPSATPAVLAGGNIVTISGMTLYMSTEVNPAISTAIMNQVASTGLSVLCDYVYSYKIVVGASTSQSLSFRFNRGHGRKLKYIITAPVNANETLNTMYDTSNVSVYNTIPVLGTKITNFYTLLNNNRLQEFNLDPTLYDDWNLIKDQLKGSVIQDSNMYAYNWFWCDNFCSTSLLHDDENLDCGLPLDVEQKWDIYYTCIASAYNHYTFAITQKMLTINSQGITII